MTINVGPNTVVGTYPITVTGSGGGKQHSATVTLTVGAATSITYVQMNYATPQSPQTAVNVTYSAAQGAGDLNVVVVGWNDSTAAVSSVTDSKGNVYSRAVGPTAISGTLSQSVYYAKNIVAAAAKANTVTVKFSTAATYPDIRIVEYSGADPNSPVDVTAAASGNSNSSNSGSATTTNPTDLIFGANIVTTITSGPGSGFTSRMITSPDGDIAEDRMVTSAGSYNAMAPLSSGAWIMQMVAFRTPSSQADFALSASPTSLSVMQGDQGSSAISSTIRGGFNSAVTLSASGVPNGTTVSFSPNPIAAPGSGSSIMTIDVGAGTALGTYPITVTGSGGGLQHSTTVTLTVTDPPDYTISANPPAVSVAQGGQGNSTITTTIIGSFNNAINLSASGVPSGTTVTFNPNQIAAPGNGSSYMTINVGASTALGSYPITVTGSGGGVRHSTTVTLTVTNGSDFTISASPMSLNLLQGSQGTSTIRTTISGGFNSAVTLSASGVPNGAVVSFSPNPIPAPGGGQSVMTITVGINTLQGTYPIVIKGSGGGIQHSITLSLTVTGEVSLSWTASGSQGVIGYNVYRSTTKGGPYGKINSSVVPSTSYIDQAVQDGFTYYYVTTAVNQQQQESDYSNEASTTMP
jgi:uncharacterized membrane protein